ncbi:MAG: 2-C-methyl-D-erythritol 2,4-cyclodiphosphate synthase [Omnitrophica bacterium GWA2_41_15]|nr:MAG: 2-C-methyl-D-erythritol 2,4-cyclodiphosphate synthase [Omnitrophica bacterium GWA2_41_15]HAZ10246.1 2-C-methyl-D-erythritol 2,4-cyclodiphosphate synthase [Candidatus Omnitrophota bacterium]
MRVGIGYDIHRFVEGRPLMLGGVEIPHIKGLEGHSDGDALLHAICDAILGAGGMDDIGHQFPVNDDRYLNISSAELLKEVSKKIQKKGLRVEYVDSVIILEEPKIAPFKDSMRREISASLGIAMDSVSVKATTQEGIGAIGRGEALAAYAIACLENQ